MIVTKMIKQIIALSLLVNLSVGTENHAIKNTRPIIGILAQEAYSIQQLYPDEEIHSYIAASYVKFVESAGGRVLPVMIGRDNDYYKNIVNVTNGLLLPGGGVYFNESDGFADAGLLLYKYAKELNDNGDFYPIWGTCLGMELMAQAAIDGQEIRAHCSSKKVSLPLKFKNDYKSSRLFANASNEIVNILATENVTVNSHGYCFTEKNFTKFHLNEQLRIMSTNYDKFGLEFISSFEHFKYPFYGVQFHPEKNIFEFEKAETTLHTQNAILTSQYFANFFMEECRRNEHNFELDLKSHLIYKYSPRYTGILGSIYEQVYVFTKKD